MLELSMGEVVLLTGACTDSILNLEWVAESYAPGSSSRLSLDEGVVEYKKLREKLMAEAARRRALV